MLKAWSYSRLTDFEQCKRRVKLKAIDRIPEPPRPLPPGKTEHANERGTRVHDAAERYVRGGVEMLPELKNFEAEFIQLRRLYEQNKVSLEGDWAFDDEWNIVDWKSTDCWLRLKLDAMVLLTPEHGVVIDYKTGKLAGKHIKYTEQMQLYQVSAFLRNPGLKRITVELWMLDEDDIMRIEFTRVQGLKLLKKFDERGRKMTTEQEFPPNANIFSCRWCPYNGNACKEGVSNTPKPAFRRPPPAQAAGGFIPWD